MVKGNKLNHFFKGGVIGLLNGFFGSGGGVVAVPILEKECSANEAHATSVALIFLLSLVTAVSYGISGDLDFKTAFEYIPWGIAGAVTGSLFLKKIRADWLKRIFGGVVTAAAVRMLLP